MLLGLLLILFIGVASTANLASDYLRFVIVQHVETACDVMHENGAHLRLGEVLRASRRCLVSRFNVWEESQAKIRTLTGVAEVKVQCP